MSPCSVRVLQAKMLPCQKLRFWKEVLRQKDLHFGSTRQFSSGLSCILQGFLACELNRQRKGKEFESLSGSASVRPKVWRYRTYQRFLPFVNFRCRSHFIHLSSSRSPAKRSCYPGNTADWVSRMDTQCSNMNRTCKSSLVSLTRCQWVWWRPWCHICSNLSSVLLRQLRTRHQ